MYSNFFGFSEKPFDLTPDPRYLYLTPGHREALAALIYGIRERKGFIVLVGEVGTGKTTLLNALFDHLDEKTRIAFVFNTDLTFNQLLNMAVVDLGLARPDEPLSVLEVFRRLNEFAIRQMARGGNVALLVDEAQNLDRPSMENIRLLSNLETCKHKLIQIILSAQPELDRKLSRPELRQFAQRISMKRYIMPLSEEETYQYINHRLRVAGHRGSALFSRRAQQLVWAYSQGVPRKINVVCDNALLIGYALRKKIIKTNEVEEAIKDLSWSPFSDSREAKATPAIRQISAEVRPFRSRFTMVATLVLTACIVFIGGFLLGSSRLSFKGSGPTPVSTLTRDRGKIQKDSSDRSLTPVQPMIHEQREPSQNVTLSIALQEGSEPTTGASAEKRRDHPTLNEEATEIAH